MKQLFTWMLILCYAVVLTGCNEEPAAAPAGGDVTPAADSHEGTPSHEGGEGEAKEGEGEAKEGEATEGEAKEGETSEGESGSTTE